MEGLGWFVFFLAVPFHSLKKTAASFKNMSHCLANGNYGTLTVCPVLVNVLTMAMNGFLLLFFLMLLRPNSGFCNPWLQLAFLLFPLLCSALASIFLCDLVTSGGLGKSHLAASSQMANDFLQWLWLHQNKQVSFAWSLATNQTWNFSGAQLEGGHKLLHSWVHGLGFSFFGHIACRLVCIKQFLAFLGICWCGQMFLDLLISGLDQSLQFLALGQTGILGQFATAYQLANGIVGGTELEELLVVVPLNQICRNGDWLLLLVSDLATVGNVHHGWLQIAGTQGFANLEPKNIGPMHSQNKIEKHMWQKDGFCGL